MLATGLVSGGIAILATRSGANIEKIKEGKTRLENQLNELLKQVEAYHLLEDLYANQIALSDSGKAARTIKTEFRNRVVEEHQCDRPELISNEAKKRLKKFT